MTCNEGTRVTPAVLLMGMGAKDDAAVELGAEKRETAQSGDGMRMAGRVGDGGCSAARGGASGTMVNPRCFASRN